jgi:uncharacterized membrane protein YcaP (DUF421 family)
MSVLDSVFGHGRDLDSLQMGARAFVLFFVALALIRVGGMRTFGRKSSLDSVIVIVLGAVLARPIVGASPAIPVVVAAFVLVLVHRVVARLTASVPWLDRLVKGTPATLYEHSTLDTTAMHRAGISENDLVEAVHRHALKRHLEDVDTVVVEASGELSVIE